MVQPHTCLSNKGKENHQQFTARYLARRILGLVDDNNDISMSSLQQSISGFVRYDVTYGKAWRAKQIALVIRWGYLERSVQQGAPHLMCNALLQPWLEMVCGHWRDVFSGPIEACPLSCVLVICANGTCIPILSASRTC